MSSPNAGIAGQSKENSQAQMTWPEALEMTQNGTWLRRLAKGKLAQTKMIALSQDCDSVAYYGNGGCWAMVPNKLKAVNTKELLEVRAGWHSDNFHKACRKPRFVSKVREDCCLSIIFRHRQKLQKSVDMVAKSPGERDAWITVLSAIIDQRKENQYRFNDAQWLHEYFTKADSDKDGSLAFQEIWSLLQDFQLEISEESARKLYDDTYKMEKADVLKKKRSNEVPLAVAPILEHIHVKHGEVSLDKVGFVHFFEALTIRQELVDIIKKYSAQSVHCLTPQELRQFLNDQGYTDVSEADCVNLVTKHAISDANKRQRMLGPSGFRSLLLTRFGDPLVPGSRTVYQDMTQPMSHYFVYGSHNTYLTGHQLQGDASVEGYISALNKGAKLMECEWGIFDWLWQWVSWTTVELR